MEDEKTLHSITKFVALEGAIIAVLLHFYLPKDKHHSDHWEPADILFMDTLDGVFNGRS